MRKIPYRKIFWSKVGTKRKLNHLEKVFYVVTYRRFPFNRRFPFKKIMLKENEG